MNIMNIIRLYFSPLRHPAAQGILAAFAILVAIAIPICLQIQENTERADAQIDHLKTEKLIIMLGDFPELRPAVLDALDDGHISHREYGAIEDSYLVLHWSDQQDEARKELNKALFPADSI